MAQCNQGCGRPAAQGFPTCCQTCKQTRCVTHGPRCNAAYKVAVQCINPACSNPSWNKTPGQYCGSICKQLVEGHVPAQANVQWAYCQGKDCSKPSFNGQPGAYCSKHCMRDHLCKQSSCDKPTWNGMPFEYCGTECRNRGKQARICEIEGCEDKKVRMWGRYCSKACKNAGQKLKAATSTTCKADGCVKPSWNGMPDEYCTTRCRDEHQEKLKVIEAQQKVQEEQDRKAEEADLKAVVKEFSQRRCQKRPSQSLVAQPKCMRRGCHKPTWNKQPYEWCGTGCREAVLGPAGGIFSAQLVELLDWLAKDINIADDVIGEVLEQCSRLKLTKQTLGRMTKEDLRECFALGVALQIRESLDEGDRGQASFGSSAEGKEAPQDGGGIVVFEIKLGSSGFGESWKAKYKGQDCSVRRALCSGSKNLPHTLLREAFCLVKHDNPLIVRVLDVFVGQLHVNPEVNIIMEYCDRSDLVKRIEDQKPKGPFPEAVACHILVSITSALKFMHTSGVAHKDLKPNNVFFCSDPEAEGGERIKVADFGIAYIIRNARAGEKGRNELWRSHMPPEDSENLLGFFSGDVWAVGLMATEVARLKMQPRRLSIQEHVDKLLRDPELDRYSEAYRGPDGIIQRALCIAPEKRATASDLLRLNLLRPFIPQPLEGSGIDHVEEFMRTAPWMQPISKLADNQLEDVGAFPGSVKLCKFDHANCNEACRAAQHSLDSLIHNDRNSTFFQRYVIRQSWFCRCPHRERTFVGKLLDLNENLQNQRAFSLERELGDALESDGIWRREVLKYFDNYPSLLGRHDSGLVDKVRVHIAFHATSSVESAEFVMKGGFANLQKLDAGNFGSGIYVTLDAAYAVEEYGQGVFNLPQVPLMVCAVVIGNPFPIIEAADSDHSYSGYPIKSKADAHVVVVGKEPVAPGEQPNNPGPVDPKYWGELPTFTEIALHEAQVLPLAMLLVAKR